MYPGKSTHLLSSVLTRFIAQMTENDGLLKSVVILVALLFIVVASIYLYLFFKKTKFRYLSRIQKHIEHILAQIITEDRPDTYVVPQRLHKILDNDVARQFAVDELVRCRKNFSGMLAEGIANLYIQLGLKEFSLAKLKRSRQWHIKARGIQELYLMGQGDTLTTIYKNTNDRNEFVRMEAQTGVIHLTGFAGLRFLDIISYPLTEWQQLKLLEQLRRNSGKADFSNRLPKWLRSKNNTVVRFALKLAEEYQQFGVTEHIRHCLWHPDQEVRRQAIRTLVQLADEKTAITLCNCFVQEPLKNQFAILDALEGIATEEQSDFLKEQLTHPDDAVKMKVAAILAACSAGGMAFIGDKALEKPEPYQRIYQAVKEMQ